jgi:hypothetical protein
MTGLFQRMNGQSGSKIVTKLTSDDFYFGVTSILSKKEADKCNQRA